jgi:hypothetical protein
MSNKPSALVTARAALKKAEEDFGNPQRLVHLKNAVHSLLEVMSGAAPKIEKDIAKKLALSCRTKVLSEAQLMLANLDSCEAADLQYWNDVMEIFVDAGLDEEPEFRSCRTRLLARRGSPSVEEVTTAPEGMLTEKLQGGRRENDGVLRTVGESGTMLHAKSLRTIGRSLAMLRLPAFRLETTGDCYIVRSESLTAVHQWILKNYFAEKIGNSPVPDQKNTEFTAGDGWLCYGPRDIARLNQEEPEKSSYREPEQTGETDQLAQLLCALGEHLDSKEAAVFEISWSPDAIAVDYRTTNGASEHQKFTVKKLHQLSVYSRFRRPSRGPRRWAPVEKSAVGVGTALLRERATEK